MFDHEKLQVYGKALDFAAKAGTWTSTWDKKHALVDQRDGVGILNPERQSGGQSVRQSGWE
jgi:hypothetical protein